MKTLFWLKYAVPAAALLIGSCDGALSVDNGTAREITDFKARYSFEETTGATATNSENDYFNGTISNGSRVAGKIGNGIEFTAANAKVTFSGGATAVTAKEVVFTGDRLSFAAWVKPTVSLASKVMLLAGDNSGGQQSFFIVLNNGKIELRLWDNNAFSTIITSTASVPQGSWTHVAVTYDGTTAVAYINGVQDTSAQISHPVHKLFARFYIGMTEDTATQYTGLIDELVLENVTWTAQQVADLHLES